MKRLKKEDRAGLYITVIVHLTVIIVLLASQLSLALRKEESFVLDFSRQETIERLQQELAFKEEISRRIDEIIASGGGSVEEGVPDVAHVGAYLVRAAGFEDALDEGDVAETFQHMPVGDSMFAPVGVGGDMDNTAVGGEALEVAFDGAVVVVEVAPDEGLVFALDGVVKELFGKEGLGLLCLGNKHET